MLNSTQYMSKVEEAWNNSGFTGTNPYTADKSRTDLANTNWLDELFTSGKSQNLQLTASGGNDKLQYLMSGGLNKQDGIVVKRTTGQKPQFRTNINAGCRSLSVGNNLPS